MKKNNIVKINKEDNNFQKFEVLKTNRNKRFKYQEFFVEGVRNINQAIENGWDIKNFLYSGQRVLSSWAEEVLKTVDVEENFELTGELMKKLSSKEDTSELIAIVSMKPDDTKRIVLDSNPLIVVFDRASNKGNLGTIIRSCDAFKCNGLILTGHSVDKFDPDTISSSMGSFFSVPTINMSSHKEVAQWLEGVKEKFHDLQIVGTSAQGESIAEDYSFYKPTVLLIGNETTGLSKNYKEICDKLVCIPMGGTASSFNVGCAASILFFEVCRQRGFENFYQ